MHDPFNQLLKYSEHISGEDFVKNVMAHLHKKQRLRRLIITLATVFSVLVILLLDTSLDLSPFQTLITLVQQVPLQVDISTLPQHFPAVFSLLTLSGLSLWLWLVES